METNPAARLYVSMLNRIKNNKEPVDLNTGGFLKRPVTDTNLDNNDVAGRAAHYFTQIHKERMQFKNGGDTDA